MAKKTQDQPPVVIEQENTALDHDPEARMIAERVLALKSEAAWKLPIARGKPMTGEPLKDWVKRRFDADAQAAVELGIGLILLKRELGHGSFEGFLRDEGVSPRAARERIQSARLLILLSDANRRRAADLPKRKLAALASAPAPLIEDLFNSGALDHAADMSREQLRELISLRKEIEKQAEREETLNNIIGEQDEQLRKRRALPESALFVQELRRAVLDETDALRVNAHTLQAVMDKVAMLPADLPRADLDAIIHPLMWALQGLHATAAALFDHAHQRYTDYHLDVDVLPPLLDEDEVRRSVSVRDDFMAAAAQRERFRQSDIALPPKRGRQASR